MPLHAATEGKPADIRYTGVKRYYLSNQTRLETWGCERRYSIIIPLSAVKKTQDGDIVSMYGKEKIVVWVFIAVSATSASPCMMRHISRR